MDPYIKNIKYETVAKLTELASVQPDQGAGKTLAQNKFVSVAFFAFDKGGKISQV